MTTGHSPNVESKTGEYDIQQQLACKARASTSANVWARLKGQIKTLPRTRRASHRTPTFVPKPRGYTVYTHLLPAIFTIENYFSPLFHPLFERKTSPFVYSPAPQRLTNLHVTARRKHPPLPFSLSPHRERSAHKPGPFNLAV